MKLSTPDIEALFHAANRVVVFVVAVTDDGFAKKPVTRFRRHIT